MKKAMAIIFVSCLAAGGCGEKQEASVKNDSTVFVSVAGQDITVSAVSNRVMMLVKAQEAQGRKVPEKMFPYWANATAMKMVPALVAAIRFDRLLEGRKIFPTPTSDAAVLDRYNQLFKTNFKTKAEMAKSLGTLGDTFLEQFARESRMEQWYKTSPLFQVRERDKIGYCNMFTNRLNAAKAKNEAAVRKANETYDRLSAGGKWDDIARETTEEGKDGNESAKEYWRVWDSLEFRSIQPQALAEAVARLEPGQFTKPIETDEGIVIVKFIEKTEDDLYKCARILFELAIVPVPVPEKDLEAHVASRKRASWQRSMQDEVVEAYPAKFPLGTNFVYKIWKEPRPLRKGFNPMQLQ